MKTQNLCALAGMALAVAIPWNVAPAWAQEPATGVIEGGFRLPPGGGDPAAASQGRSRDSLLDQIAELRQVEENLRKQLAVTPGDRQLRARLLGTIHVKYRLARVILGDDIRDAQRELSRRQFARARMLAAAKRCEQAAPGRGELAELRGHASAFRRFCEWRTGDGSTKAALIADALTGFELRLDLKQANSSARREIERLTAEAERDIAGWREVVHTISRVLIGLSRRERNEMNAAIKSCS